MGLREAIDQIQDVTGAVTGIRKAPDDPPESFNAFPVAVCHPRAGLYRVDSMRTGLHDLALWILVARKDLPRDVSTSLPYGDSISQAILDAYTDGELDEIDAMGLIRYTFGEVEWGGLKCIGWSFTIEGVKIQNVS